MENPSNEHSNVPEHDSTDRFDGSAEEAVAEDSMSAASTDAYELDEEFDEDMSDDDGAVTLEDVLGEESAEFLRWTLVYTRELRDEISQGQAMLNRLRTYLVRHGYGRNTCNREDHYYSVFLSYQSKIVRNEEFLKEVIPKIDFIRTRLELLGIELE